MQIDESLSFYDENYLPIYSYNLSQGHDKINYGCKNKKNCRFCKSKLAKFKKDAHILPEAIGNKWLFSFHECDDCNNFFGRTIENDFGNWSKPMRSIMRIKGKNGVPSIRFDKDGKARVDCKGNELSFKSFEDDKFFQIDEKKKEITFSIKRDPYTPLAVLKAFFKFGLCILSDEEVNKYQKLISWVSKEDHSVKYITQCSLFYTFIEGSLTNDKIHFSMFKKKSDGKPELPNFFYILAYGNEVYQVFLPEDYDDAIQKNITLPAFPTPYHLSNEFICRTTCLDFLCSEIQKNDIQNITMQYETADGMN